MTEQQKGILDFDDQKIKDLSKQNYIDEVEGLNNESKK